MALRLPMNLPGRILLILPILPAIAGCMTPQPKPVSLLKPSQMSVDSVAMEIIFVRFPAGDKEINGRLWEEVDEQHFAPEIRQRLAKNGFRVGLVGGQVPAALARLLELKEDAPQPGEVQKANLAELAAEPRVNLRHLQTRSGKRNEVIASGVYDHLPVLVAESGELRGQTYSQAQGLLALTAFPQADGRVRVDLVPEIHHDQTRQHWVGDQSMWRLEASRPKRVLDHLRISASLTPGTMMLLTSQSDRPGSLGHYFFTEGDAKDNRLEQKLLVLRVCQTQHDDLTSPPPLSLKE
jgi:hypothetical protein